MSSRTKQFIAVVGMAIMAATSLPATAMAGGARLYEMTENMKLDSKGKFTRRNAVSQLIGTADVGTPLCPTELVTHFAPTATTCTINATGVDSISLSTGLGPVSGTYTVVVQGDNNADSPELVITRGTFSGRMDFSPAILFGIPLGHVTGKTADLTNRKSSPFTGTFRLPFVISGLGADGKPCTPSGGDATCFPVNDAFFFGSAPTPLNPMDRYDLVNATRPLYLQDDGSVDAVESSEFGGGWATVKFEISF